MSCDLMGVLVARASGRSFSAFLEEERLFGPFGMKDMAFWIPARRSRLLLAGCCVFNHASGKLEEFDATGEARATGAARQPSNRARAGWRRRPATTSPSVA